MPRMSFRRNSSFTRSHLNGDTVKRSLKHRVFAALTLLILALASSAALSAQIVNQNFLALPVSALSMLSTSAFAANNSPMMATLVVDDNLSCGGATYSDIQSAVTAAAPNDTIQVCSGTYPIASTILLNKAGLTLVGTGATKPIVQIPASTGNGFHINAANVTLDNFEIQKTDLLGAPHELILVQGNSFTAQNNLIYGPNPGSAWSVNGLVSRAFVVTGGLSGLLFHNNVIHTLRQPAYINGPTTGTISNNNVSGTRGWVIDGATINFTNNTFGPPANQGADIALLPSTNPADYPDLEALSANNDNAVISAQFAGGTSGSSTTYVDDSAPAGGIGTVDAPFQTIQQGINGVYSGGTVNVASGTYVEDVTINKADITLNGDGAANTTISGAIGGSEGATVRVAANNAEIRGFTITRQGNNTTDWNDAGLNFAGIAIQGIATTGMLVHDNIITGNRTGIDINNSNGHTIRNNVIDFNRTGLIFRNQTDNITFVENFVRDNWTVGILFLDASGGTNSPVQSAVNSVFNNNNLSGNWYGEVVDRQSGGSLPAPGTTNLKDFRYNWWGTTSPVVTTAHSAEPGYSAQIPVAYGGSATAPGGQPDIAGPASANIIYQPVLQSGTDSDVETTPGRGTFGFQSAANTVVVSPSNTQGWAFFDESPAGGTGSGAFTGGPGTPPLGIGSATMTVNSTGREILFNNNSPFLGTRFDQITALNYSSYQNTNAANPEVAVSLQFAVDYDLNDANTTFQGRLVYEPYQGVPGGTVQQNVWQSWDALGGRWWASRTNATGSNGACPQSNPCTRAQLLATFPNLGIHTNPNHGGMLFRLGGPISGGMTASVDAFTFGVNNANTIYDFEPTRPSVTINQAAGQADPTSSSPVNFTVTFSEPVTGFDSSDIVLSGTAGATTAIVTGSGAVYNVAVSGMTAAGTVIATVANNAALSAANAPSSASTSTDNTVTYLTCNNVSIPTGTTVPTSTQFLVPINVDNTTGRNILAYDFTLTYNPAVITPIGVETAGTLSSGWTITTNNSSGTLVVSGFSTSPLSGAGTLLNIRFISTGGIGTNSALNLTEFTFNEGVPCVNVSNGNVTVIAGTISGRVTYANAAMSTPVPNTTLNASGSIPVSGSTDANGDYSLSGFGAGPYTVTPSKTGQANGISNADATAVAQHVVGFITLNSNQQMAADVSGNGTITSLDASYIAQYVAGFSNPSSTGTWKFNPVNRSYPNVQTSYTNQDYSAILMGEVTGNWNPAMAFAASLEVTDKKQTSRKEDGKQVDSAQPEQVVTVTAPLPQFTVAGTNFTVNLQASNTTGEGVFGYEFNLLYDANIVIPQAANPCDGTGTISAGRSIVCNPNTPGLLRVVVFSTTGTPISGSGVLLKLNFTAVGAEGSSSPLTFQNFMFNEGTPQDITVDGRVQILDPAGPTAASASIAGRVVSASGRVIPRARIAITGTDGEVRTTNSNQFGRFSFNDLKVGETYVISASSKGYNFAPQAVSVVENLKELALIADQ